MKTDLFNIKIDIVSELGFLAECSTILSENSKKTVFFINAHCFNIAQINNQYKNALNSADFVLNDGIGIEIASKIANIKLNGNLNGTDLIPKIINLAQLNDNKIFLLGGKDNTALNAKKTLEEKHKHIKIVGYNSGYFDKIEEEALINKINESKAEILIIGMGVPMQEIWIQENKDKLSSVKLFVAGGAILDFIAGNVKRAPMFLRNLKMEWVFRLVQEPKRLFRRYLVGNFVFFFYIISFKLSYNNIFNVKNTIGNILNSINIIKEKKGKERTEDEKVHN